MLQMEQRRTYLTTQRRSLISLIIVHRVIGLPWRSSSEVEFNNMTSHVVADNSRPSTTISIGNPRGQSVGAIQDTLLEFQKGFFLTLNADSVNRVAIANANNGNVSDQNEKGKQKKDKSSH
ncbi:hypothetical protein SLA2020_182940 [Shorea laevis]